MISTLETCRASWALDSKLHIFKSSRLDYSYPVLGKSNRNGEGLSMSVRGTFPVPWSPFKIRFQMLEIWRTWISRILDYWRWSAAFSRQDHGYSLDCLQNQLLYSYSILALSHPPLLNTTTSTGSALLLPGTVVVFQGELNFLLRGCFLFLECFDHWQFNDDALPLQPYPCKSN